MTTTKVANASSDPFGPPLHLASTPDIILELFNRLDCMVLGYVRPDDNGQRKCNAVLKGNAGSFFFLCDLVNRQAEQDYGF